MTTTRRQTLRLFAAAAIAGALPMGHRPAVLAVENTGIDVLDDAEAEQELAGRQRWHLLGFDAVERGAAAVVIVVEPLSDGGARLVVQPPRALRRDEDYNESRDYFPRPELPQLPITLDAATFTALNRSVWNFCDRA